ITTVFDTVTRSPSKAGTRALRSAAAMQPPVGVPAKGGPLMFALVTRPDGANVTTTLATPEGSPSLRQAEACAALEVNATAAAERSKGPDGSAAGSRAGVGSGFGSSFATGAAGSGFASDCGRAASVEGSLAPLGLSRGAAAGAALAVSKVRSSVGSAVVLTATAAG